MKSIDFSNACVKAFTSIVSTNNLSVEVYENTLNATFQGDATIMLHKYSIDGSYELTLNTGGIQDILALEYLPQLDCEDIFDRRSFFIAFAKRFNLHIDQDIDLNNEWNESSEHDFTS